MNNEKRSVDVVKWLVFVVLLLAGVFLIWLRYKQYRDDRGHELLSFVQMVKAAVNSDRVASLKGNNSDLENIDYIRLKEQFSLIVNSSKSIRYLYLMGFDITRYSDKMFFLIDSQPEKIKEVKTDPSDLARPGEIYDETDDEMLDLYKYGGELITLEPETDKWGSFVSALVPITERGTGKVLAIVGADFEVDSRPVEMVKVLWIDVLVLVLILLLELIFFTNLKDRKRIDENSGWMVSILKYSGDAIYSFDVDGTILSWNLGAKNIFGYAEEEIIGKNIDVLIPKDLKWEKQNNIIIAKQGKNVSELKTQRLNKEGALIDVSLNVSPIFNKFLEVTGISVIARDVRNEQREKVEMEEKNMEMEKLNKLMVGREIKMIELKKRVEDLEAKVK
ncbi:MAG: PAS domain S-box protein [Candidatus Shapirobacteria bacterium]